MERATLMKTFHGNITPKSPTMRDRDASFSPYLIPNKPITCQPHHNTIGSGRCRALDDSTTELSIFDAHKYFSEVTTNDIQKVSISSNSRVSPLVNMDMERSIPEKGGEITDTTRYSSASSSVDGYANIRNYRARSFHAATPTASSEASWNSQAGLLSHPPGAVPVSMRNPPNPTDPNNKFKSTLSKPIWLLRKKCPCTGKKSVQVMEKTQPKTQIPTELQPQPQRNHSLNLKTHDQDSNPKTVNMDTTAPKKPEIIPITPNNWVVDQAPSSTFVTSTATKSQRFQPHRVVTSVRVPFTEGFTFPVLHPHPPPSSTSTTKPHVPNAVVLDEEYHPPRDSLEVFQPPHDATEPHSPSPKPRAAVTDEEDAASDASSDLFEIESFSTSSNTQSSTYPIIFRRSRDSIYDSSTTTTTATTGFFFGGGGCRRSMDEGSTTPAITECYEPSEASIEWSVTTAEGCYEESVTGGEGEHAGVAAAEKWRRKVGSSGNGLLAGCRSEKAVSVGPQPVKKCEGHRGATFSTKHVNVNVNTMSSNGNGSRVGSVNKPPLARSHNTTPHRVSLAFAT